MQEGDVWLGGAWSNQSLEEHLERLRAYSAGLRARKLEVRSAEVEHRVLWDEWKWQREHRARGETTGPAPQD